mmetsp:Transcript_7675/g.11327  ORF Transcript_7675/g.11327 Transcript_7675/m.11327 type:complete len:262 (-) Transcript_7675:2078-2863(-)
MLLAHLGIKLTRIRREVVLEIWVQKRRNNCHSARGIKHVHNGEVVDRLDLDSSVHARCRGTANHDRYLHATALHFLSNRHHLVERGSNEARKTQDITLLGLSRVKDLFTRAHHTDVDYVVIVATQHNTHNILANIVHVPLDSSDQHLDRLRGSHVGVREKRQAFVLLHERREVSNSLLHHTRRLDHLRQEHLPSAEEITDDVHAFHQRALDDVEGHGVGDLVKTSFFSVDDNELINALEEGVDKAVFDGFGAPLGSLLLLD